MKKIISFLLCLTMILGMVPCTATAEDAPTLQEGLYSAYEDGVLGALIPSATDDYTSYNISYTSGMAAAVFYYCPDRALVKLDGSDAIQVVHVGTDVFAVSLTSGTTELVSCDVKVQDNNGNGPNFPITFTPSNGSGDSDDDSTPTLLEGLYRTLSNGTLSEPVSTEQVGSANGYNISYPQGQSVTVYYYSLDWTCVASDENVLSVTPVENMEHVYAISPKINGTITTGVTFLDETGAPCGGFPIVFTDGTAGSGGTGDSGFSGPYGPAPGVAPNSELREILPSEVISADGLSFAPVEIKVGNETYYMGLAMWVTSEISDLDGTPCIDAGSGTDGGTGILYHYRCIAFWTDRECTTKVDNEQLAAILDAFDGTLSLTVQPASDGLSTYPAIWSTTAPTAPAGWPCAYIFGYPMGEPGVWVYNMTGTLGGQPVAAYARWTETISVPSSLDLSSMEETNPGDVVSAVNAWLQLVAAQESHDPNATYEVKLPSGDIYGTILVPSAIPSTVFINGNDSIYETVLHGGVEANNRDCAVQAIHFVGAGKNQQTWPSGINSGKPNKAFYGAAGGESRFSTFEDYYYAVESTFSVRMGALQCTFIDNHVAIYVDIPNNGNMGNGVVNRTLFQENDTAVYYKSNPSLHLCVFDSTRFIDNERDIRNETGKKYFITGNYFEHDGNTTDAVDKGKWNSGPVFICPVYTEYDPNNGFTGLYWGKNATMKNGDTEKHPIPKGKMQGKLTVIDQPDTENESSVIFDFGDEEAQTISTFSLRRMRSVEETFDATVVITKTDTTISLTINALPSGKFPVITVPCGNWTNAVVSYDDVERESDFADGSISFVAEQGGTYLIEVRYSVTFDTDGGSAVNSQSVAPGGTVLKPADPTKEGFNFKGWHLNNEAYDFASTVNSNMTLTALWETIPVVTPPYIPPYVPPVTPAPEIPIEPETPAVPEVPSVDTDAPVVDSTVTENEDGSTTTTETLENGAVVETTQNADGSSISTATKSETVETEESKTTTTTSNTTTTDAEGNTSTETKVEERVETATGTTATTTTTTESAEKKETVEEKVETVIAEDGTETTTTTSKTETELADGTTATTNVDAAGTVTAEVEIPAEVAQSGETVTLPVSGVTTTKDGETAATITVTTNNTEDTKVEIPVEDVTAGTVVVVVDAEGNETVLKDSVVTENGVVANLPDGATVKIVDNSKDFEDVKDKDWHNDAVDFASSRDLFQGVSDDKFAPSSEMTAGMLMTVLARLDGQDTTADEGEHWQQPGVDWAVANGLHDGEGASENITREKIALMLWKYAGSPDSDHSLDEYHDGDEASSDEAAAALKWAVENGVMKGMGNGKLNPKGEATRAQVAQFLKNFVENIFIS